MERYKVISGIRILLDAQGLVLLAHHKWTATRDAGGRVSIQVSEGELKGRHFTRLLLQAPSHLLVDHRDGDSTNNTIANLRLATPTQNQANRKVQTTNTSGVKGVSWCSRMSKWKAYIKRQHLGYFDNLEEAKKAYERAAELVSGDFALHLSRPSSGDNT